MGLFKENTNKRLHAVWTVPGRTMCVYILWVAPMGIEPVTLIVYVFECLFCMFLCVWYSTVGQWTGSNSLYKLFVWEMKPQFLFSSPSSALPHRGHHLWGVTLSARPPWQTPWRSILMPVRWLCARPHQRQRLRMSLAWVTSPPPATLSLRRDTVSVNLPSRSH